MAKPTRPLVATGRVEVAADGSAQLHLDAPVYYRKALPHYRGRVSVSITPELPTRSLRAGAYLFGVVYKLAIEHLREAGFAGLTALQLHEVMKERHCQETIVDPFTGEVRAIVRGTRTMDSAEFGVFLERVMADLAEHFGLSFPEPRKSEDWRPVERKAKR